MQEEPLAGAYQAIRDPLASPVGAIARTQAYTVTDTMILQGALHFEVQHPAGPAEGIVLHHWESGFSSRIKIVNGNTVRLERAVPEGIDGPCQFSTMELLVEPEAMLVETTKAWRTVFQHEDPATEQGLEDTFDALPIPEFPPLNLPKWTASDISYAVSKMKTQFARGADHWSVTEIQRLPDSILELYAWYFNAIERRILTWPSALTVGLITVIPKADNADAAAASMIPLRLRPITVLPMWYRIWARRTAAQLSPWTAAWIDTACCGCLPESSCADSTTAVALNIEDAKVRAKGPKIKEWQCRQDLCWIW